MIKMLKKLYLAFSPQTVEKFKTEKRKINNRVKRLEATLNGESHWMLEKRERTNGNNTKTFKCNCEEL